MTPWERGLALAWEVKDLPAIVKRVKAKIAADSLSSTVIHSYIYFSGDVSSDGSLVSLGKKTSSGYEYTARTEQPTSETRRATSLGSA